MHKKISWWEITLIAVTGLMLLCCVLLSLIFSYYFCCRGGKRKNLDKQRKVHPENQTYSADAINHTRIAIDELVDKRMPLPAQERSVLNTQFELLNIESEGFDSVDRKATTQLIENENWRRNRFIDISPGVSNRVRLLNFEHDYINASYIGNDHEALYIAAQGPISTTEATRDTNKQPTIDDFWHMVWQEDVHDIVMLTECVELGRTKCAQYWPMDLMATSQYGNLSVQFLAETKTDHFEIRKLKLTNLTEKSIRVISQYHYRKWLDTQKCDANQLADFIEIVRKEHIPHQKILVHCSAGVGRTGAYIAIDLLLNQFSSTYDDQYIDIFECVKNLRRQRIRMVQTADQYILIQECLIILLNRLRVKTSSTDESIVSESTMYKNDSLSTIHI